MEVCCLKKEEEPLETLLENWSMSVCMSVLTLMYFKIALPSNKWTLIFLDKGDSGSGVFVIDERDNSLKPLGIAFAFYCSKTAVCKIGQITDAFNVSVYDHEELMDIS